MKIIPICSDTGGRLSPSHGFGVLVGEVAFDACTEAAARSFLERIGVRPTLGIAGLDNPHHSGGFSVFKVPVIKWKTGILDIRLRGILFRLYGFGRETIIQIGRTVISPCGIFTVPFGKLSATDIKAVCFVGGLGGSTASPYAVARILGELRALGVRCIIPLHTPPNIIRELEPKFNVYRLGAGQEFEIPI